MGGGLLQLVAYGAQDVYLTGNPQITFFKVVYRRHTNFAMEAIQQTFNGTPGYGQTVTCQISRNGDLIHRAYLQVALPYLTGYTYNADPSTTGTRYVNYIGLKLIKNVTIEIGGQQIDKHYDNWLYIWNELSLPFGKKHGWNMMVGADGDITSSANVMSPADVANGQKTTLYIPLEFWFCRNIGLALPLIALQYHEVKVKFEIDTMANCISPLASAPSSTLDATLWIDYIFLDTDERRRFAQLSHEYLIEQLQYTGQENLIAGANRVKLNFNHPVKELIWVCKPTTISGSGVTAANQIQQWYNYTDTVSATSFNLPYDPTTMASYQYGSRAPNSRELFDATRVINPDYYGSNLQIGLVPSTGGNPVVDALLQLNGNDRFAKREGNYFNYVQPYQHHTNIPQNKGINVYSFALKPEEHQPSGSLNMSRIDTAVLSVTTSTVAGIINIYAVNYNVLRILSGMGGLAYSN